MEVKESYPLASSSVLVVGITAALATVLCSIFWGLPWWIPFHVGIVITALILRLKAAAQSGETASGASILILGFAILSLDVSIYAWGLPTWIPAVIGLIGISLIVFNFKSSFSATNASNPIALLIAIVSGRLFLALMAGTIGDVDTIPACDDFSDVLTGCSGTVGAVFSFVLGTIPAAPVWVNALVVFITNGFLIWAILDLWL